MIREDNSNEGKALFCASLVLHLYRLIGSEGIRSRLRGLVLRMEGGPRYSLTLREILRRYYRLDIGLYTEWPCGRKPSVFHPGTRVGRYCRIADTVRTFTRHHPINLISTHGLFYNPALGKVKGEPLEFNSLAVGNGVQIGHNAILMFPAERIGDGAMIAPGSVVYSNVPPYACVSGFPALVTGYRFDKQTIAELLASRWWEKSPVELRADRERLRPLAAGTRS